jgi:hypothetical protein
MRIAFSAFLDQPGNKRFDDSTQALRLSSHAFDLDQPDNKRFNSVTIPHKRYASVLTCL